MWKSGKGAGTKHLAGLNKLPRDDPELKRIIDELINPAQEEIRWDFPAMVERSALAHMIRTAEQSGIRLIIARHKARPYAEDPDFETDEMRKYTADLAQYLKSHGVHFLDYTHHPELKLEHYGKGSHLKRSTGRPIWTAAMAADLKAILDRPEEVHIILHGNSVISNQPGFFTL